MFPELFPVYTLINVTSSLHTKTTTIFSRWPIPFCLHFKVIVYALQRPLRAYQGAKKRKGKKKVFSENFGVKMAVKPQKVVIFSWKKKVPQKKKKKVIHTGLQGEE